MAKIKSFGADVYINGIAVGGLTDISASGTDVSMIGTTSHDESSGFQTFVSGLKDGGTLELTGKYNYADAGQAEWKAEEGVSHAFYIILSDNSGLAFNAVVGGFQTSNPLDYAVEFTASAKITGEVYPVFPTITVTGTLTYDGSTPVSINELPYVELNNGKASYTSEFGDSVYWDGAKWILFHYGTDAEWHSADDVATPDLASTWTPQGSATGTPTLTGS